MGGREDGWGPCACPVGIAITSGSHDDHWQAAQQDEDKHKAPTSTPRLSLSLQINNLSPHTPHIVIHIQQSNAASRLATTVGRAPRIEQQLPTSILVPGDMTMPKHHAAGCGEFLTRHPFAVMRLAQDMNDTNTAMPDHHLTFDGQFPYYLILLNIALHRHYGRNCLQLGKHRQHRHITCVNNQLDAREMLPESIGQAFEMRNMRIRNDSNFSGHTFFFPYALETRNPKTFSYMKRIYYIQLSIEAESNLNQIGISRTTGDEITYW